MFIQKVSITNFKSYRNEVVFDDLSPKVNLLVGENGSGKTNFLDAIMFVLGGNNDKHVTRQARRALLYDSDKPGSVEISFGHLRSVRGNVISCLKRKISLEEEKFFVNGKSISRDKFTRMLETSGLLDMRYRHQYITQCMMSHIADASNAELLKLLNVAGIKNVDDENQEANQEAAFCRVYEFKLKNMTSHYATVEKSITTSREQRIVQQRITNWTDKQQVLEWVLRDKRFKEATRKMTQLEDEKNRLHAKMDELKSDFHFAAEAKLSAKRVMFQQSMLGTAEEKVLKMNEEKISLGVSARILRVVVDVLKTQIARCRDLEEATEGKMSSLNDTIKQVTGWLEEVYSSREEMKREESEVVLNLAVMLQKIEELQDKEARLKRFTSKDERDREIQTELEALGEQLFAKLNDQRRCKEELRNYTEEMESLTAASKLPEEEMDELKEIFLESCKRLFECEIKKDQQERKTRFLTERTTDLEYELLLLREELHSFDAEFFEAAERDVFVGQESVDIVLDSWKSRGGLMADLAATKYHGMVIDSFDCDWSFYVPICVTAGKKLFRHIVDSREVAYAIMEEVQSQNLPGRIEFLYLDRVRSVDQTYPLNVECVIPLMEKLIYEPKYEEALKELFGRTLLCTSFKVSPSIVGMFDCVTFEGQQVSLKAYLMSGKLPDSSPTIIDVYKHRRTLKNDVSDVQKEFEKTFKEMILEKKKLKNLIVEMNTLEGNYGEYIYGGERDFQQKGEAVLSSQSGKKNMVFDKKCAIDLKKMELANCDLSIGVLRTAIEVREAELLEEFSAGLPAQNQEEPISLRGEIFKRNQSLELTRQNLIQLKLKKKCLTEQLKFVSLRKNDMIMDLLQNFGDYKEELWRQKETELTLVCQSIQETTEDMEDRIQSLVTYREKIMREVLLQRREVAKLKNAKENLKRVTDEFFNVADACFVHKCRMQAHIAGSKSFVGKCDQSDRLKKYSRWDKKKILKELRIVNNKLKASSALLITSTGEQMEELCQKHEKMRERTPKLEDLRRILVSLKSDDKEKEFLEFVFEDLRHHFLEKFQKFVPEGRAELYLLTEERTSVAEELDSDDYVGLAVRASFDGSDWEGAICEFSSGQQAVIASALLFALQECFPLPYILLDEVDKAFSVGPYADAFYDLIRIHSEKSQIIAASFAPGMINCADRVYGVEMRNRMSYAEHVDKNDARQYLRGDDANDNSE